MSSADPCCSFSFVICSCAEEGAPAEGAEGSGSDDDDDDEEASAEEDDSEGDDDDDDEEEGGAGPGTAALLGNPDEGSDDDEDGEPPEPIAPLPLLAGDACRAPLRAHARASARGLGEHRVPAAMPCIASPSASTLFSSVHLLSLCLSIRLQRSTLATSAGVPPLQRAPSLDLALRRLPPRARTTRRTRSQRRRRRAARRASPPQSEAARGMLRRRRRTRRKTTSKCCCCSLVL